jgi:HD-like signal output (HDOD) protein
LRKETNVETSLDEDLQLQLQNARLPTLPAIAVQLMGLGSSKSADVSQLVEIVANDPAISASLVRQANSATFHRVRPADSVSRAVSYLGFARSRMTALSATLLPALTDGREPAFCFTAFWRRSLIAGACALAIGRRLFSDDAEALLLAALVQDIGILALAQLPLPIYGRMRGGDFTHLAAVVNERRVIHEDHGAVGAWLLERWNFPARLVRAVRFSNNLALLRASSEGVDFNAGVMAAGLMADAWMWNSPPPDLDALQADISRLLRLDWPQVLELFNEASFEIPLVEALCSIQVTDPGSIQLALSLLRKASPSLGLQSGP